MCTKFRVDSSRRFPFRARTNRHTNKQTKQADATERPTHVGGYTAGVCNNHNNNNAIKKIAIKMVVYWQFMIR